MLAAAWRDIFFNRFWRAVKAAGVLLLWAGATHSGAATPATCAEASAATCPHGGQAREIILLQQQLANHPEDPVARDRLKTLLEQTGATGTALDLPTGALLRERTWWRDLVPMLQHSAWVAVELGHDSNINSGTPDEVVHVPLLNYRSLTLSPLLVQTPSHFLGLRTGAMARYPLSPNWALRVGGMAALRLNTEQYVYLPHSYEGRLALERDFGLWRVEAGVSGTQRWVVNYQAIGRSSFYAQVTRLFEHGVTGLAQVEHSKNRYPLFSETDTSENAMTLSMIHAGTGLQASVSGGRERATGVTKALDRDYLGYTLAWVSKTFSNGRVRLSFSENRAYYDEPSPLFLTTRHDLLRDYSVAYEYRLPDNWSITPRYVREENGSTVSLMKYTRTQWMIEARKEF